MGARDTIAAIAEELAAVFGPLVDALAEPDNFVSFMWDLGWEVDQIPPPLQTLAAPAQALSDMLDAGEIDVTSAPTVIDGIRALLGLVDQLGTIPDAALPPTIDSAAFRAEFPRQLVDTLIVDHLFASHERWATLLKAAGVIRLEQVPAAGLRPPYLKRSIAFQDFGQLLSDPLALIKSAYKWGAPDFRAEAFIQDMAAAMLSWGMSPVAVTLDDQLAGFLKQGALPTHIRDVHQFALRQSFVGDVGEAFELDSGAQLFMLPETPTDLPGFSLLPYAHGALSTDLELTDTISILVKGDGDFSAGVGVLIRPNKSIQLLKDIIPSANSSVTPPSGLRLTFGVQVKPGDDDEAILLLGSSEGSRLETKAMSALVGVDARAQGANDLFLELALTESKLVIAPGTDADGFLARLLPAEPLIAEFTLGVGLSTAQGLYFTGSSALEIQLPTHIQLGPIEVVSALIGIKPEAGKIPVDLTATIKGDLAVIKATVENIGLRATFTFPNDRKGNLGPANLGLGFRPPTGVGLVVDAGVVKGGGYLSFDFEKGEYAGALELTISGFLSLKAIGLINTKLPGGQPGFSMLIIITAEFNPGFQLGFGFVLAGVGGLLGLNRAVLLDPLAQAVRTGAASHLLFPTNIVENAPRILSDLRVIFPPYEGKFLIGPMAKLGWGTPTLISVSLGIIIEIPGNAVILGRLRLNLPTEEQALVLLQVVFVGAIEFDKRRIWFFASLFESRVLFITLDGEMGLLMDFSDNPNFVLSVGGFHPRFPAPALPFPAPKRIALSLINESYARVRIEGYFAVTTNSVQFGASAEMFFGFDALSVSGHLTFDALFRFSPVYFIVDISAGFSVKVFGVGVYGVRLRGSLEGPAPWRVRGSASISLFFFDIDVDVDVTFGDRHNDTLPPISVMALVSAEINKPENWVASLPPSGQLLTSLRDLSQQGVLVLHPVGTLRISQRAVPLNVTLDKVGNQKAEDVNELTMSVTSGGLTLLGGARESFARAQYQEMEDAQKLSQPPFEKLDGGIELAAGAEQWASGPAADRTVRYETIIVDSAFKEFRSRFFEFWGTLFVHFRAGAAISKSSLSLAVERQKQPFAAKVDLAGDQYAVAFSSNNASYAASSVFGSQAEAERHMTDVLRTNPALAEELHVIPAVELNRAA